MALTRDDLSRREATLRELHAQQASIRGQLQEAQDDSDGTRLTLERRIKLEERLQASLNLETRFLGLARAAEGQPPPSGVRDQDVKPKREVVVKNGLLSPLATPARPNNPPGSSTIVDLTCDSEDEEPVPNDTERVISTSGGYPLRSSPKVQETTKMSRRATKRRKPDGERPPAEKVIVDLTLDSSEDEQPTVKRELSVSRTSSIPAVRTPSPVIWEPEEEDVKPVIEPDVSEPRADSPAGHQLEERQVDPGIELDVTRPRRRGDAPRMVGEKRVRKVILRVKEEGEGGSLALDPRCRESIGEDLVVPKDAWCTASRTAINHVLGGNVQDTFPKVSKNVYFERVKKNDEILCASLEWNPDMPTEPGQHGIMLSSMDLEEDQSISTFVRTASNTWLYIGDCVVFGRADLPTTVWNEMRDSTKKTWADHLLKKQWGHRWLNSIRFPANRRTLDNILEALSSGGIIISITILKCVAYDLGLAAALGEAQKGWVNGTVGSRKIYEKGQTRSWVLTLGGDQWLQDTAAGQSWLQDDPEGRRFAQLSTREEKRRWAAEPIRGERGQRADKRKATRPAGRRQPKRVRAIAPKADPDASDVSEDDGGPVAHTMPTRILPARARPRRIVQDSEESEASDAAVERGSDEDYSP